MKKTIRLGKRNIKANFSGDSDLWFDRLADEGITEETQPLLDIANSEPTEQNLQKVIDYLKLRTLPGRLDMLILNFASGIKNGAYDNEFKNIYGDHSATSEMFSFLRQAITYDRDGLAPLDDNDKDASKKKTGGIHAEPYKEIDLSEIGIEALEDLSGPGQKDQIADEWREALDFTVDPDGTRRHLEMLGIEDTDEMDEDTLANYILWIMANDWYEDQEYYDIDDPDKRWWYFGE